MVHAWCVWQQWKWEPLADVPTLVFYLMMVGTMAYSACAAPDTSVKSWAFSEAEERARRRERGEEVVFGRNYAGARALNIDLEKANDAMDA